MLSSVPFAFTGLGTGQSPASLFCSLFATEHCKQQVSPDVLDLLSAPTQKNTTFQAAGLSANCWQ